MLLAQRCLLRKRQLFPGLVRCNVSAELHRSDMAGSELPVHVPDSRFEEVIVLVLIEVDSFRETGRQCLDTAMQFVQWNSLLCRRRTMLR